ncbi:hypothetical protein [Pedococcus bigeumensis]|jgi:hypothetical protein|uniref:hypothetical protein n=1 Tax=Pedococcus bigeumensis TaxID=433644 RepID=UPI002FED82CE
MTITTTKLVRAAGLCAVVAGLLFIAVQIKHPPIDVAFVSTTEWKLRQGAKVLMAVLSLAGITGMYLRQVKQTRVLGLLGYVLFSVGYLLMLGLEIVGLVVLPSIADTSPGYVADVVAAATNGKPVGDIGLMGPLSTANGVTYLLGGFLFGVALFRANVLARWAAVVLSAGTVATIAIPIVPQVNFRLFALPIGVAMVGLGYSLWREGRSSATRPAATSTIARHDLAGAK